MTDDAEVRRALGALAGRDGEREPRHVVESAATATGRVTDAVAFLAGDGGDRLRHAVERAERRGDHEVARTGRRVLDTLARYRRVARRGHAHSTRGDHIHSGRGTVLHGDGELTDR